MRTTIQSKANYKPMRKMNTGKYIIMVKLEDVDETSCLVCQGLFDKVPNKKELLYKVTPLINEWAKNKIIEGFYWEGNQVWLSTENQINYKTAYDLAVQTGGDNLPYTIKVGSEDAPKFITFEYLSDFRNFYLEMTSHVQEWQHKAWAIKELPDFPQE